MNKTNEDWCFIFYFSSLSAPQTDRTFPNSGLSVAKNGIGNVRLQSLLADTVADLLSICTDEKNVLIILMIMSSEPHFRLSSASLPKSEIAVVLGLFEE